MNLLLWGLAMAHSADLDLDLAREAGPAAVGHPGGRATAQLLAKGKLGGFYHVTVEDDGGVFGGEVLIANGAVVTARGLPAAAAALREAKAVDQVGLTAWDVALLLEHLGALPGGFTAQDAADPRSTLATGGQLVLALYCSASRYDARTGVSSDLGGGGLSASELAIRATLVVGGDRLAWTVEREGPAGTWSLVSRQATVP